MAQLNFDANTVAPQQAFEPLPAGWYQVQIIESEMKPTRNGSGAYLQLTMEVLSGQYANRKIFDRLNLQNANQVAVEIAYQTLSAICHATGQIQVQDSQQLHMKPMEAKVSVRAATGEYEASNDVKGYRPMNAGGAAAPSGPAMASAAPAAPQAPVAPTAPAAPQQAQQAAPAAWGAQQQQAAPQAAAPAPQAAAPAPAEAPQQQQQAAPVAWGGINQQPAQDGMATGHPTEGAAPSAQVAPATTPWGQPAQ